MPVPRSERSHYGASPARASCALGSYARPGSGRINEDRAHNERAWIPAGKEGRAVKICGRSPRQSGNRTAIAACECGLAGHGGAVPAFRAGQVNEAHVNEAHVNMLHLAMTGQTDRRSTVTSGQFALCSTGSSTKRPDSYSGEHMPNAQSTGINKIDRSTADTSKLFME